MGLLKPSEGSITINGIDVYNISNCEKCKIFGYVDQSFHIIKCTVADQISLQDNSITREQIQSALDFVGLADYVASLENGRVKNAGSPEMLLQNDEWYRNHIALEKLTWS